MARDRPCSLGARRRAIRLTKASPGRANGGSTLASTPTNTPSRAITSPARARRSACPIEARKAKSEFPGRMNSHYSAGHARVLDAGKASFADHVGEALGRRKLANRLYEIAIGRPIAGNDLADRRNGRLGIEVIETIEDRRVDAREFEAQKPAAAPQYAIGFRERPRDARHVANAESDRVALE